MTHEITQKAGIRVYNGAKIVTSPALGDLDGDGVPEVVSAVNEQYAETPNSDDTALQAVGTVNGTGNDRVYAVFHDGTLHGTPTTTPGAHPNPQAYLPGWPARIATAALELLPTVGDGPTGSPVIGDVDGDGQNEVAVFGTAGPGYVLGPDGRSVYGQDAQGRDRTLSMAAVGAGTNSPDAPSIPAAGGGILTDITGTGRLDYAVPAAGLGKLLDLVLPDDQLVSDNHLAVYDTSGTRAQLPAFPREVNDLQFLSTPGSADLDGDGLEEVMTGTAYSDLHAFDVTGAEPGLTTLAPDGWPKFTGGWVVATPAVGDLDGDGSREVAVATREGTLFVWHANGATTCDAASWPEAGHDGRSSSNAGTDAVRPARVTDLEVELTADEVILTFTAPGDDGRCGRAAAYDVRWAGSEVTDATWASATPFAGLPAPSPAGTPERIVLPRPTSGPVSVALKTYDADPATATAAAPANVSAISGDPADDAPDPVVPESPLAVLLPLLGLVLAAVLVRRRTSTR